MKGILDIIKDNNKRQVLMLCLVVIFLIISFLGILLSINNEKIYSKVLKNEDQEESKHLEEEEDDKDKIIEIKIPEKNENDESTQIICSKELIVVYDKNEYNNIKLYSKIKATYNDNNMDFLLYEKYDVENMKKNNDDASLEEKEEFLKIIDKDYKMKSEESNNTYNSKSDNNIIEYNVSGNHSGFVLYTSKSVPTAELFKEYYMSNGYTCE